MKILLLKTDDFPHGITEAHVQQIQEVDASVEVVDVPARDEEKVQQHLVDAEIVAGALPGLPSSYADAKQLKWIQVFAAGVDKVLTPEVKESDVIVGNVSGIHAVPIAEHILGFILIFTRTFHHSFRSQEKKVWDRSAHPTELRDKTVLVVGLGHIGTEAAKILHCVGARVLAVDQSEKEKPEFVEQVYSTEQLPDALSEADFVVLSLPHTDATHHLFDMEKFRMMKDTAVLINIGRGPVVHEQELIQALQEKIIAGVALDVTEVEPLPKNSPLWQMENVVITPHHSGYSEKYMDRSIDYFCENLEAYIKGEPLPHVVDKQKGY